MLTVMMELKNKLQVVVDEIEEEFTDGTVNQFNAGYKEAMVSVIKDIDAQMLEKERSNIINCWHDGYTTGCVVGGQDYTNETEEDCGEFYFNKTFTNQ